ncbi:MAG: hypothetical protein AVDCRST_MAG54-868 [uncultured Actinomycetospora sp.]|uniref:General stress protein 17M-like domain-containing protein n=1 Tax=uncultured Actinomycetospora sp. TaxID=1135996 RepID=A0A6J4HL74_9PSEU|nr:MAG: hypothetical protein AVDCRST_MAG54-868 [uncultured Actinomycetospora sp.]
MNGLTVPVAIVGSRTEAELIVGFLQNQGVRAAVAADDAGGQEPELQLQGVRVLVASSDETEARRHLTAVGDGDGDGTSITGDTVTGRPRSARETLRVHTEYDDAQRDVDALSDAGFPVERVSIVGRDLRLDEDVTGRLTVPRAAGAGAGGGAWFGLLIGAVLFLFTPYWLLPVLTGVVLGAIFGAIFGAIAQAATRGRRDFASVRHLEAGSYEVVVDSELADGARRLLHLDPAPEPRDASPAPADPPRVR